MDQGSSKAQGPCPNNHQDDKPLSEICSALQSPKSGLWGHGAFLHFENQSKSKTFDLGFTKVQGPYPNHDQGAKP